MSSRHDRSGGGQGMGGREPTATGGGPPHCILLVDDDRDLLELLTRILRRNDRVVICAEDFAAARARLDEHAVSLLLTELQLGNGRKNEGLDLLAFVRRHRPDTRTLVLSADLTAHARRQAARHGVRLMMEKPFDVEALQAAVHRLLAV